jgi:MoaA/NifB/PqqE/SkfB family radical SAM enzyme
MYCRHCGSPQTYERLSKELTTKEATDCFSQIKENFDLSRFRYVSLTGGEVFLRKDLLEMLELFHGFNWVSTIQTNGNHLASHLNLIPKLVALGVGGIGVDLDGTQKFHDDFRRSPGHHNQTKHLLRELLNFRDSLHITATTVVTKANLNQLNKTWEEILEINPHRWRLLPIENVGRAKELDLCLNGAELIKLLGFIKKRIILHANKPKKVQVELGCVGWVGREQEGWVRPYIGCCNAGKTCLGIRHDGDLGACASIDPHFSEGNVRCDNIKKTWENCYPLYRDRNKPESCKGCPESLLCTTPMHKRIPGTNEIRDCVFKQIEKERKSKREGG